MRGQTVIYILVVLIALGCGWLGGYLFFRVKEKELHNSLAETQRLVGLIHRQIKMNQKRKWAETR
jgi:uncharacterized protein YneF (UPF0154 family)